MHGINQLGILLLSNGYRIRIALTYTEKGIGAISHRKDMTYTLEKGRPPEKPLKCFVY